jgi:hypothetical protein
MNKTYRILLNFILLLLLCSVSLAQYKPGKERGDPSKRTKGQMEGNQVRATIENFGLTGRTGAAPISDQTPYEWPKNTGKVYLAMTQLWTGGEVVDKDGKTIRIIDIANGRSSPSGNSWNFEPLPGYYNENFESSRNFRMANSVEKATWPDFWPDKLVDSVDPGWRGSWNGYFGKNLFNADQELFYRSSDDRYDRYNYFPDTTDLTRKGMGIVFDSRTLAWSQVLVEDVVYNLNTIKNDGTKDISKFAACIWYADFVGGDGDSQDDISEFDLLEDIAWSRDGNNKAPLFGSDPVGIIGVSFLETPGNSTDRIDNDNDGEIGGPIVTSAMLDGEIADDLIDNNGNGLIDENQTHVPFQDQIGNTYADYIDQNNNAEAGSPVVTAEMVSLTQNDKWKRWPINPDSDPIQNGKVWLLMVEDDDLGHAFKDNIDNNNNGEEGSPVVTQAMIDASATDAPYFRYKVPGTSIILFDLKSEDLGKKYADGKDNDGNGAVDEYMDEGIDEMIDESRNNGIDDDGDWNPLTDDVGLDGAPDTFDFGEGDGKPTPGRNGLPGEPGIDVTDVSETDQIGITNAQYIPAGGTNLNNDNALWIANFIPGKFYDPKLVTQGEYDLFVTSSFFPLKAGQTEPISLAFILANGPIVDPDGLIRKGEIKKKKIRAQETYNNDYKFANAPLIPKLTAVSGDNKVTLYWDNIAESSYDSYIANIGGIGNDFEGYRIYRASDPAFEDAVQITSGQGILKFKYPIKIFDKEDKKKGYYPLFVDGVHYYLGDDSGIQHSWIDTTVQNGFTYYYALTSFDFGYEVGNITPSECPIRISLRSDGSVSLGSNVVKVKPEAPAAGYVPSTLGKINPIKGSTTGQISYSVLDDNFIKDQHVYYITFEDTLKPGDRPKNKPDTLTTKSFTLTDSTENRVVLKSYIVDENFEQKLTDGFRLKFVNEKSVELNKSISKWNTANIPSFILEKFALGTIRGVESPSDYLIIFGDIGTGVSKEAKFGTSTFKSKQVNFKVYNKSTSKFIDFVFIEVDSTAYGKPGELSAKGAFKDRIVFLEPNKVGNLDYTWWFYLSGEPDTAHGFRIPKAGDTAYVFLKKPFLSQDVFRFVTTKAKIDNEKAKVDLDKIQVVPNPYVANALWEPKNPYVTGRGPREIHFTHLPSKCTIRIFTINGELVKEIEHESQLSDGTESWDLLTKDNLTISYGVYIFHVDAGVIGEKIGKFAVIK